MERVIVRQATYDDFDGVVRISKGIYDGYDHLPDMYFKCLENPNRCAQVAELNGEIVAFNAVLVVDAGRTAIVQYGRSDERIRGTGVYRHLILREFIEFVLPKFPCIVRARTTSTSTDFWDAKNDGTIIEMTRVLVCFCNDPIPYEDFVRLLSKRITALKQQLPIDSLSPANGNTLNDILADPVSKKHIFPEGIIASESEVYDAHESNTHMIMQSCAASFVGGNASSMYTSLSFGHTFTCPKGRLYEIDYYGTKDDSIILAHVSRHLPLAHEISRKEPVSFNLCVKEACMGEETKQRFDEFSAANISPHGPPPQYLRMYSMTHLMRPQNSKL